MDESDLTHYEPERGAVRRYETPRERKFLYWLFGFVCGAICIALAVVLFDRFGGRLNSLTASTGSPPPAAVASPEDSDFARARKSVAATLEDPSAATFDALTVAANGPNKLVCGYVSSKGPDGAPRRTPFIYHPRADLSFVLVNRKEAFVAGPAIVNACFPTYVVPRTALDASRE